MVLEVCGCFCAWMHKIPDETLTQALYIARLQGVAVFTFKRTECPRCSKGPIWALRGERLLPLITWLDKHYREKNG